MSALRSAFQLAVGMIALASRPVLAVLRDGGALPSELEMAWAHRLVGALVETGEKAGGLLALGAQLLSPLALLAPLRRWEARGKAEEREGILLAHLAVNRLRDAVFDELARSTELKQLVHTQSQSLTQSAVEEVRSVGARADDRAERMVRRLLRRRR